MFLLCDCTLTQLYCFLWAIVHLLWTLSLDPRALQFTTCIVVYILYVHHWYLNTVPQIVGTVLFQTLWKSRYNCFNNIIVKPAAKKLVLFKTSYCQVKTVQGKSSCIVVHCDTITKKQSSLSARCAVLWLT